MKERAEFIIRCAEEHGPITVRGIYYQAQVAGVPGIDKTEASYEKVQRQTLSLRREGRLDYEHIADREASSGSATSIVKGARTTSTLDCAS